MGEPTQWLSKDWFHRVLKFILNSTNKKPAPALFIIIQKKYQVAKKLIQKMTKFIMGELINWLAMNWSYWTSS